MIWLALGVLLWGCAHLFPSAAVPTRSRLIERLGEKNYQGAFALTIVLSVVLMVVGWRSSLASASYGPPSWGAGAALPLVFVALFLFAASGAGSNINRLIRHPQLTGVAVWAGSHLLGNGDNRSLLLFGGLGSWAIVAMLFINRRDGSWNRPEPQPMLAEWKPLVGAAVAFALLVFAHPYIAGVPAMLR